jgi:hypothetical protein
MDPVEDWTRNWCYFDDTVNLDIITVATERDITTARTTNLDLNKDHNNFYSRFNKERCRRELRIVRMEGCSNPLGRILFKITKKGTKVTQE